MISKETIRYLIFGVLTSIVNFSTFALLMFLFDGSFYLTSNVISFIIATVFAFITNKLFVFESKDKNANVVIREFTSFVSSRIISFLIIEEFGLFLAVSVLCFNSIISKVILAFVSVAVNYILSKVFIFKKGSRVQDV